MSEKTMSEKIYTRQLSSNRRARHEYSIEDRFEAGMVLTGTEVKAARTGKVQLREAHVEFRNGEAWLMGANISVYSHGNRENHLPDRPRKLLLKKRELERLEGKVQTKGYTIVPLSLYLKGRRVKIEIALATGKKLHDKRQVARERELDKEAREAMKYGQRG